MLKRISGLIAFFSITAVTLAVSPLPVTDGLVMHLDANSIMDYNTAGVFKKWVDISGTGRDANSVGPNTPVRVANVLNGKPVVRFAGNSGYNGTCTYFTFNEISNIRTVFWVFKETRPTGLNRFLLGHHSSYDFHRGGYNMWSSSWSNANIRNGTTRLNGSTVDGTITEPPTTNFGIVSLRTTGNVSADQLTRDRANNNASWYGDIAEVIVYNRALMDVEENQVGYYLATKYAISTDYSAYTPPYAANPSPVSDDAGIPASGVSLTWNVLHGTSPTSTVWFGPKGNMTQRATGVTTNTWTTGALNPDSIYEWRIDVVDGGVTRIGATWSFRTILGATKIIDWGLGSTSNMITIPSHQTFVEEANITATASGDSWGPASSTINNNGLYGMQHIVYPYGYSWISDLNGGTEVHPVDGSDSSNWGAWIEYAFDTVQNIGTMYIWNQNQVYAKDLTNRGLRNVTVQYSVDGTAWTTLGNYEIPKANGLNGLFPYTINFGGIIAKYVVITAALTDGLWGPDEGSSDSYYALAKVRFGINGTVASDVITPDMAGSLTGGYGIVKGQPYIVEGLSSTDTSMDFSVGSDGIISNLLDPNFPAIGNKQWSMNVYLYFNEEPNQSDLIAGFGSPNGAEGTFRYFLNYGSAGGRHNQIYFWGLNSYDVATGVPFDIARWQMLTATYDGGHLKVYKNGILIGSKTLTSFMDAVPAIHMANSNSRKFKGRIDNFTMYKGVLSQSEISTLAAALPLKGDFNKDAKVDLKDLGTFVGKWLDNTKIQSWPTVMLLDMEDPNSFNLWTVPTAWNTGTATVKLIKGNADNPSDPNQPFAGMYAIRMTYDNTSGHNTWSSVDVNLPAVYDMTKYDLLRFHLKRHIDNSRETQLFIRGYSPSGQELFNVAETVYSTNLPAGVWEQSDGRDNGNVVIWYNQISNAHQVSRLKIGAYAYNPGGANGGTGTIDIDNVTLERFDNCLGTIQEGDFNSDCIIDLKDFTKLADNWLLSK